MLRFVFELLRHFSSTNPSMSEYDDLDFDFSPEELDTVPYLTQISQRPTSPSPAAHNPPTFENNTGNSTSVELSTDKTANTSVVNAENVGSSSEPPTRPHAATIETTTSNVPPGVPQPATTPIVVQPAPPAPARTLSRTSSAPRNSPFVLIPSSSRASSQS